MRTKLNLMLSPLWPYCLASLAVHKLIVIKAHIPFLASAPNGFRVFIIPEVKRDRITLTALYRPLRALLLPDRLADVDALKNDLQTPEWRKLCRAWVSFEITENGPRFLNSEASVRSKKYLSNPDVDRIPTLSEMQKSLSK